MAVCIVDDDGKGLPSLATISVKYNDAITMGSPNHLNKLGLHALPNSPFARAFDKHFDSFADQLALIFHGDAVGNGEQLLIASCLYFLRYIVGQTLRSLGAGADAVLENKTIFNLKKSYILRL